MMPLIDLDEFEKKYAEFEKLDFKNKPHTFHGFWSYRLSVEKQGAHLLDADNFDQTLSMLEPVLKIWQWHRPYEFEYCFQRFRKAIRNISGSYLKIRRFSLTEFDQVPMEELRKVWNEFGSVKPQGEYDEGELVMTITKPLMFIWGQTPAFDSHLRDKMPLFSVPGFRNVRWEFSTWISVMRKLQNYLNSNAKVLDLFNTTCVDKYGTDVNVPYGQFFDLYYWTKSEKESCFEENSSIGKEEPIPYYEDLRKKEFSDFIGLLNNLKNSNKITAKEWREYEKQWIEYPQTRPGLIERLKHV